MKYPAPLRWKLAKKRCRGERPNIDNRYRGRDKYMKHLQARSVFLIQIHEYLEDVHVAVDRIYHPQFNNNNKKKQEK